MSSALHGGIVVDKPRGPTSHDVVGRMRRILGTRRIGHTGTLDPMASGVMVLLVGEATKLASYLTLHDKRYRARLAFGLSTTTLDAEGAPVATEAAPSWLRDELAAIAVAKQGPVQIARGHVRSIVLQGPVQIARGHVRSIVLQGPVQIARGPVRSIVLQGPRDVSAELGQRAPRVMEALAAELARTMQMPPAHSAIKIGGRPSYALARAGQPAELEERAVRILDLDVLGADAALGDPEAPGQPVAQDAALPWLDIDLTVSKGYYVRSFARDVGEHLGVPSHLAALRRTQSGPFDLDGALPLDAPTDSFRQALRPLPVLAQAVLPLTRLTAEGAAKARFGQPLGPADFSEPLPPGRSAWLGPAGDLVAIGIERDGAGFVERGFQAADSA